MNTKNKIFEKSFTQQQPLSASAINKATEVMRTGRLHRYNVIEGEVSDVSMLEREFANHLGVKYCLACTSGGYALHIALKSIGIKPNEAVITNGFTLAPVPGAIDNAGATPLLVETNNDLTIDLNDLDSKASMHNVRVLLLSHMRGHIGDMNTILAICKKYKLLLVEDCAHTMGAAWRGKKSGTFGDIACFSTQTYKHINSGEGGLLTTNDDTFMAKAVIHSGSYMLYELNGTIPDQNTFDAISPGTPNYSGRMDNLRAAILRDQLLNLDASCNKWNELYETLQSRLMLIDGISLPDRSSDEQFVGSSIQFFADLKSDNMIKMFVQRCQQRGVSIKWFGDENPQGYTSRFDSWHYINPAPHLPATLRVLAKLCDMRIPLTFNHADCQLIADIIEDTIVDLL